MQSYLVNNLRQLSKVYSQKQIAADTNSSASSINNYINKESDPGVDFLIALKKAYNINIDDFLFKRMEDISTEKKQQVNLDRFIGSYIVYYYDSSAYKGRVNNDIKNTLNYGIISVYKDADIFHNPSLLVKAKFMLERKEAESKLKEFAGKEPGEILSYYDLSAESYTGKLDYNNNQLSISLDHKLDIDKCLMLFNNPPGSNEYIGGLGTVNSISRGREHMPCIQYTLLSRNLLQISDGEIYNILALDTIDMELDKEADKIITLFKNLYLTQQGSMETFTEFQKRKIVEDTLNHIIRETIEANMFRFAKVSNMEDDKYYRLIKDNVSYDE